MDSDSDSDSDSWIRILGFGFLDSESDSWIRGFLDSRVLAELNSISLKVLKSRTSQVLNEKKGLN